MRCDLPRPVPLLLALALVPFGALGLPAPGSAQNPAGPASIRGIVFDSLRGGPLPGARVLLEPAGRDTVTDDTGRFAFGGLDDGRYRLSFTHPDLPTWAVEGSATGVSVSGTGRTSASRPLRPSTSSTATAPTPGSDSGR